VDDRANFLVPSHMILSAYTTIHWGQASFCALAGYGHRCAETALADGVVIDDGVATGRPGLVKAAQGLDVDLKQLARSLALVAPYGRVRLHIPIRPSFRCLSTRLTMAPDPSVCSADGLAGSGVGERLSICSITFGLA
jgi:hypothetical protein